MILDTSALAAIFFGEPEAALYTELIHAADCCLISAANFLEHPRTRPPALLGDYWENM
jgi:ribonuclease VapC